MKTNQTPIKLEEINDSIYVGLKSRLVCFLLDGLIISPWMFLLLYLNSLGINIFFYTLIPSLLFVTWYNIYLVKKYGGTPGKLIMGLQIIKSDGKPVELREAILRYSVLLFLTILNLALLTFCLLKVDTGVYNGISWLKKETYLRTIEPSLNVILNSLYSIWIISGVITILSKPKKRAVHDYIAGTVIVKKKYINNINDVMYHEIQHKEPHISAR